MASILIALVAAGFTGLQWREAHNQLLLSLKPHVDFDTEDDPDATPVGIAIINEGPAPALVKSLAYFVDRKRVKDLDEAATAGQYIGARTTLLRRSRGAAQKSSGLPGCGHSADIFSGILVGYALTH